MTNGKNEKPGRGWHGDAAGHAKAGRLGGKARAQKKKQGQTENKEKK